jgi:hypothetical protein
MLEPVGPQQLALSFEDTPPWDKAALEQELLREAGAPLRVTITGNRSVLLSYRRATGAVELRLHEMFLWAPAAVVRALSSGVRRETRRARREIRRFINENLHRVKEAPRALPPLVTAGAVHDLSRIYARVNAAHFEGRLQVPLTWGRGRGRARRRGLTFGSYDPVLGLIRIHPVLDREDVPEFFVESVVHHEMLHHALGGVSDRAGRTIYHTRAFREAEARHPRHAEAMEWERANLARLVRASRALRRAGPVPGALRQRS